MALGRTRSASRASRSTSRRAPHSIGNSVASAPTRSMIPRISRPNAPAPTTSTRSPGSMIDSAPASSAVRPEPGMMMTSLFVWKTSRRARVVGSSTPSSKERSYWMAEGWFMAWMTGNGSSVGPGIMSVGRVCTWVQLIVDGTVISSEGRSAAWPRIDADCITPRSPRRFRRRHGERRSARAAEIGVRRARVATALALEVRLGVAMVDDQIADIGDPGEGIREDEHRVALAKRVDQQEDRPDQAQPPEGGRHHDASQFFRRVPLHEESRKEHEVAEPADDLPDAPIDPEQLAVVYEEARGPVHHSGSGRQGHQASAALPWDVKKPCRRSLGGPGR